MKIVIKEKLHLNQKMINIKIWINIYLKKNRFEEIYFLMIQKIIMKIINLMIQIVNIKSIKQDRIIYKL